MAYLKHDEVTEDVFTRLIIPFEKRVHVKSNIY